MKRIFLMTSLLAISSFASARPQRLEHRVAKTAHHDVPGPVWETLPTEAFPGKRDDVSFVDSLNGWYGTGKGDLFHTTDGAKSWQKVGSHPGTFIRSLAFINQRTGFIGNVGTGYYPGVTDETPLYRTDDAGKTWTPVELPGIKAAGVCSIDVLRTQRLYQGRLIPSTVITAAGRVGGPAAIIQSSDGGQTWRTTDMSQQTGMILDVHFVDEQTGFVAASSSRDIASTNAQILITRDGGVTWKEVYRSKRPGELIWKMSFPSRKTAYGSVMSQNPKNLAQVIVKTSDGGRTWQERPMVTDRRAVELGIGFVDQNHGWVGTMVGGFETFDGGGSFRKVAIAPAANKFRVVHEANGGSVVYTIGTQLQRLALRR